MNRIRKSVIRNFVNVLMTKKYHFLMQQLPENLMMKVFLIGYKITKIIRYKFTALYVLN